MAKTMSGWSRRITRYRSSVEAVVWLVDDEADLSVEVVVLSEVGEDHFCAAPGRSAAAAVKCGFGGERRRNRGARAEEVERLGGMACTHPAAAKPRAGSGEASIGSKERSSKRDAGLGAWRLSLSGEAACVKTVAIFDGGFPTCETPQEPPRKRI